MKKMKRLFIWAFIWWCLLSQTLSAANRNASVSGNWNDTATWGGASVPSATDEARIYGGITVTIPVGVTATALSVIVGGISGSGNAAILINNGTLTIGGTGSYLKVGSGTGYDGVLTLGPDSVINNEDNISFNNGIWNTSGTSKDHPAYVLGAGNITSVGVTGPRQIVNLQYVSFQITGQVKFYLQDTTGLSSGASSFTMSNCVWYGTNGITIGSTDTPNTTPYIINNNDFRSFGATKSITILRANGGLATYTFNGNTISQPAGAQFILGPTTSTGLTIDGNVFDNVKVNLPAIGGFTVTNNFMSNRTAVGQTLVIGNGAANTITGNYVRTSLSDADNNGGWGSTGAAGAGTDTISGNVFESVLVSDKPDFFLPGATPQATNFINNLLFGTGEMVVGYLVPNWQTLNLKHNTHACTYDAAVINCGHLYVPENATKSSGTLNIANNIYTGNGHAGNNAIAGATSDTQIVDYSDYNVFYNPTAAYSDTKLTISTGNTAKTIPGSADIGTNPKFLDSTRNLAKWNAKFGSGTETAEAAVTYLLAKNGYEDTGKTQNGTPSTYTIANALTWVRYGFSPTDGSMYHTGDDGATRGAIEWQNPRRKHH